MAFESWPIIFGDWDLTNGQARYQGADGPGNGVGFILSPAQLTGGEVQVLTRMESIDVGQREQPATENPNLPAGSRIVFGYEPSSASGYLVGIGSPVGHYILQRFKAGGGDEWKWFTAVGQPRNLEPDRDYHLRVRVTGSRVMLAVDGTPVLDAELPSTPLGSQLGLWANGVERVTFKDFEAATKKPHLFVVMQFGSPYDDIFKEVIEPVGRAAGFDTLRADDMHGPGMILADIVRAIRESTVVVAEVSATNPNVYYEIGYAHAAGTPTILLVRRGEALPFDISGFRCILYDDTIGGKRHVEAELRNHLAAITSASSSLLPIA